MEKSPTSIMIFSFYKSRLDLKNSFPWIECTSAGGHPQPTETPPQMLLRAGGTQNSL